MIKLLYPQGCYGNYFARCILNYSNLRQEKFVPLDFDSNGSSHFYRSSKYSRLVVKPCHVDDYKQNNKDHTVILLPDDNHTLDYCDANLFKQYNGHIFDYAAKLFPLKEISQKLIANWGYTGPINSSVPVWIVREWCSFWLPVMFERHYSRNLYNYPNSVSIEVSDMMLDIVSSLEKVFDYLGLEFSVDEKIIKGTHRDFLDRQKFHGRQIVVSHWIDSLMHKAKDFDLPEKTIFDEAFIQFKLASMGYDVYCENLNEFPSSSRNMRSLIYKK